MGDAFDADGGERVPRAEILSKAAVGMRWVVPAAVLLARGARGSVAEAREAEGWWAEATAAAEARSGTLSTSAFEYNSEELHSLNELVENIIFA